MNKNWIGKKSKKITVVQTNKIEWPYGWNDLTLKTKREIFKAVLDIGKIPPLKVI